MKKTVSILLCLMLALSLVSVAVAATMTSSVENKAKPIAADSTAIVEGESTTIPVVTTGTAPSGSDKEIVITSVSVLTGGTIGGNLKTDDITNWSTDSQQTIKNILGAAMVELQKEGNTLYTLTQNNPNFNRNDLKVCNLFEVSYAVGTAGVFTKTPYSGKPITLTFTGITEHIVAVLHGNDEGTAWTPMSFKQEGTTVTVYGFQDFSPVAMIAGAKGTATIQPGGSGGSGAGTAPTSPQTGASPAAAIVCSLSVALMGVCYVVRRKEKNA